MTPKEIENKILMAKKVIEKEVTDVLPRKVGVAAVNHFNQNFRDGGFHDGVFRQWKRSLRQDDSFNKNRKYKTLYSREPNLARGIEFKPGYGEVTITNPVPYAAIHNEGGTVTTHPTISQKMRKMAWARAYSIAGVKKGDKLPKELPEEAKKWKALALTKKSQLNITANIPKRQFIGDSAELRQKVEKIITDSITAIRSRLPK